MCFNSNLYGFEQNGDRILLNLSSLRTDSEPAGEFPSRAGQGEKPWGGGMRERWDVGAVPACQGPPAMARRLCRLVRNMSGGQEPAFSPLIRMAL